MDLDGQFFLLSELDRTSYPEFRERILRFEREGVVHDSRAYAGHPVEPLVKARPRLLPSLDRALTARRSVRALGEQLPTRRTLGRLLQFAHGVNASLHRGPVPSGGNLHALELYAVPLVEGWLAPGGYHYDRASHALVRVASGATREAWGVRVPSLAQCEGGALLWVVVGDGQRVTQKYGARGYRFLLLEAGHLMQNLCLLSATLDLCTLPLGGFFEGEVARELRLPRGDVVLYLGVCGKPAQPPPS